MSESFQVFFRTNRGGCGIEYETALTEFLTVFKDCQVKILLELPFRMRIHVAMSDTTDEEISRRAQRLGYTQGILRVHEEPYQGEELHSHRTGRWIEGWIRKDDKKLLLTEIYRQDESATTRNAPHQRVFFVEVDGEVVPAKGHRYHRGLSPLDVKLILNISDLCGNERILDPFAGIGGIVLECIARGFETYSADIDHFLRPGLARISKGRHAVADARKLPFKDHLFDAVITEPPFNTRYRQAVMSAIPELQRIVRPNGKIVLLIARDMYNPTIELMSRSEFRLVSNLVIRRHGKLKSHLLRFDG